MMPGNRIKTVTNPSKQTKLNGNGIIDNKKCDNNLQSTPLMTRIEDGIKVQVHQKQKKQTKRRWLPSFLRKPDWKAENWIYENGWLRLVDPETKTVDGQMRLPIMAALTREPSSNYESGFKITLTVITTESRHGSDIFRVQFKTPTKSVAAHWIRRLTNPYRPCAPPTINIHDAVALTLPISPLKSTKTGCGRLDAPNPAEEPEAEAVLSPPAPSISDLAIGATSAALKFDPRCSDDEELINKKKPTPLNSRSNNSKTDKKGEMQQVEMVAIESAEEISLGASEIDEKDSRRSHRIIQPCLTTSNASKTTQATSAAAISDVLEAEAEAEAHSTDKKKETFASTRAFRQSNNENISEKKLKYEKLLISMNPPEAQRKLAQHEDILQKTEERAERKAGKPEERKTLVPIAADEEEEEEEEDAAAEPPLNNNNKPRLKQQTSCFMIPRRLVHFGVLPPLSSPEGDLSESDEQEGGHHQMHPQTAGPAEDEAVIPSITGSPSVTTVIQRFNNDNGNISRITTDSNSNSPHSSERLVPKYSLTRRPTCLQKPLSQYRPTPSITSSASSLDQNQSSKLMKRAKSSTSKTIGAAVAQQQLNRSPTAQQPHDQEADSSSSLSSCSHYVPPAQPYQLDVRRFLMIHDNKNSDNNSEQRWRNNGEHNGDQRRRLPSSPTTESSDENDDAAVLPSNFAGQPSMSSVGTDSTIIQKLSNLQLSSPKSSHHSTSSLLSQPNDVPLYIDPDHKPPQPQALTIRQRRSIIPSIRHQQSVNNRQQQSPPTSRKQSIETALADCSMQQYQKQQLQQPTAAAKMSRKASINLNESIRKSYDYDYGGDEGREINSGAVGTAVKGTEIEPPGADPVDGVESRQMTTSLSINSIPDSGVHVQGSTEIRSLEAAMDSRSRYCTSGAAKSFRTTNDEINNNAFRPSEPFRRKVPRRFRSTIEDEPDDGYMNWSRTADLEESFSSTLCDPSEVRSSASRVASIFHNQTSVDVVNIRFFSIYL